MYIILVEKLKKFESVCKFAKENGVKVNDTEFLSYIAVMNALEKNDFKLVEEELGLLVDRVDDIYLDTDSEYANCSIQEIADYCVEYYGNIDEESNTEILENICC